MRSSQITRPNPFTLPNTADKKGCSSCLGETKGGRQDITEDTIGSGLSLEEKMQRTLGKEKEG